LGGFPERSPLNARVVGSGHGDGFRYERIIYDSLPDYPVTAVLFLPESPGPYPAVLVPCGHSDNGKASELYQHACILLARHGIAAFIYDPIGQGERYLYLDEHNKPLFGTTQEHTTVGVGCMLTGTNLAMYRIWDGMRGLDYLQSRADVDGERLGCTGNSGGGTLTSYLMALDDRIVAAAPSCYLTTFDHLLTSIGPQDAEQNIAAQVLYGMDHADYITMRAPKPTLMCVAKQDYFPLAGARETFKEAERLYAILGHPERIDKIEADEKHGFSTVLRVGAVNWMRRWLLNESDPIADENFEVLPESEMQCSKSGQIYTEPGYRSLHDVLIERAKELEARRDERRKTAPEAVREEIRKIFGPRASLAFDMHQGETRENKTVARITLTDNATGAKRVVPLDWHHPQNPGDDAILYLHDHGRARVAEDNRLPLWLAEGKHVIAADLSGIGETLSDENKRWAGIPGADWPDFFRAYLIGENIAWLRASEIEAILLSRFWGDGLVQIIANGDLTVPALHAAYFTCGGAEKRLSRVTLEGGIPSWQAVIHARRAKHQLMNVVPGALEVYDLPDLSAALPEGLLDWRPAAVPVF
jgi:dienelactone hydrolase